MAEKKTVSVIIVFLLIFGTLAVFSNVQPVRAIGTITINPDGSISPSTAPVYTSDKFTYTLTGDITASADGIVIERDNIVLNGAGYTVTGSGNGNGTTLTGNNNVTVRNMTIKNFYNGIYLTRPSSNTTLSGNNIANNLNGIILYWSSSNTVSGNNIASNYFEGIYLMASDSNTVSGNNITNNDIGIDLYSSYSNDVLGNNITNNNDGIYFKASGNNIIYHNSFVNNKAQIFVWGFNVNVWDDGYPDGGNYWSDYKGTDAYSGPSQNVAGSDGIGDTPYVSPPSDKDNYPLMYPWVPIASLVVRGTDNRIYYRVSNGAGWNGWNVLPGSTIDSPAAVVLGNQLHVVVRGSDGNSLWYGYLKNITDPSSFSGWTLLSGATSSAPTLASNGNAMCLVVRGLDNRIYYRGYNNTMQVWVDWNLLPSGTTCDRPAAAMLGNTLNIVVRGYSPTNAAANNTLWYSTINWANSAFSGWTLLSGATPSSPTLATSQSFNNLYLTVKGSDNRIYYNPWNSVNWQGWNPLPTGATTNGPAAAAMGDKLCFIVTGIDGTSLWQNSLDPATGNYLGWTQLGGATPSAPTLAS